MTNATAGVQQTNQYYPFGMLFAETVGSNKQDYKYNGKELDLMLGLNHYDYSARQYDPARLQFTTRDPLAESSYAWSPYIYVENNPLRYVDPTGMKKGNPDDPVELDEVVVMVQKPQNSSASFSNTFQSMLFIMYHTAMTSLLTREFERTGHNYPHIVTDLMITYEFITGTGPQKRNLDTRHWSTVSLRQSYLTKVAYSKIKKLVDRGQMKGSVDVGFNPLEKSDSGPLTESYQDKFKYNTAQFVGSAKYDYEVVGSNVNIVVSNTTSLHSALLHIPFVGKPSRNETPLGIGGNVEQTYSFTISLYELK